MLAQLSAFDVLAFLLVFGCIGAISGYAGGAGARLLYTLRLDKIETVVLTLLNRAKGTVGGQAVQRRIERTSSAEKEAEQLAAQLQASRGRRGLFRQNDPEALALAEIEQEKAQRRKAGESGDKLKASGID